MGGGKEIRQQRQHQVICCKKVLDAADEVHNKAVHAEEELTRLLEALYVVEGTMRLITHGDRFHAVKDYFSKETD